MDAKSLCVRGLTLRILSEGAPLSGALVYLSAEPREAEEIWALLCPKPARLVAFSGFDWNRDLSPWPAEKCFRGGEDFAGGASAFLKLLTEEALPAAEEDFSSGQGGRMLAGYSMAGLFAIWAFTVSSAFDAVMSASGSLWFDSFTRYLRGAELPRAGGRAYLSLGDAEEKSRNPRLAAVGSATREAEAILRDKGVKTHFEWNAGGHFSKVPARIARGISYLLQSGEKNL